MQLASRAVACDAVPDWGITLRNVLQCITKLYRFDKMLDTEPDKLQSSCTPADRDNEMNTPAENIQRIEDLRDQVKSHWLCLRLNEAPDAFTVTFPAGYRVDGMRSVKTGGKAACLQRLLDALLRYESREWYEM